jgi:hypothetical protein
MISAILFDLYETLVTEQAASPTRASSLGERLGLDAAHFRKAWRAQRARVIRGQVSFTDSLLEIGAMLGRTLDTSVVRGLSAERRLEKAAVFQTIGSDAIGLRQLRDQWMQARGRQQLLRRGRRGLAPVLRSRVLWRIGILIRGWGRQAGARNLS